jgi:hypothetical protein
MPRVFSSFVLALALLLAPFVMSSGGEALARGHAAASATAMDSHCTDASRAPHAQKSDMSAACANACAACHPAPIIVGARIHAAGAAHPMMRPRALAGVWPEHETPPPRAAPGI